MQYMYDHHLGLPYVPCSIMGPGLISSLEAQADARTPICGRYSLMNAEHLLSCS